MIEIATNHLRGTASPTCGANGKSCGGATRLATPFQSPAWLLAWWRYFGTREPLLLTARARCELVGLLPLYLLREPGCRKLLPIGVGLSDYVEALARSGGTWRRPTGSWRRSAEMPGLGRVLAARSRAEGALAPRGRGCGLTTATIAGAALSGTGVAARPGGARTDRAAQDTARSASGANAGGSRRRGRDRDDCARRRSTRRWTICSGCTSSAGAPAASAGFAAMLGCRAFTAPRPHGSARRRYAAPLSAVGRRAPCSRSITALSPRVRPMPISAASIRRSRGSAPACRSSPMRSKQARAEGARRFDFLRGGESLQICLGCGRPRQDSRCV